MLSKKALKRAFKRELVAHLITTFGLSIRQACRSLNLSRTVYHYCPDIPPVMNLLFLHYRLLPKGIHDMVSQSYFRSFGGRDIHGIIKGSTEFTVC